MVTAKTILLVGTSMTLSLAAMPAAAQTAGPADGQANTEGPNDIVVTAQRREQNLVDVPISISVLSGQKLDHANQGVLEELARVPGIARLEAGLGGNLLTVRGVGATGPNFAGTSTIGYYLDSVPFGFVRQALSPDAGSYDLSRVEALRGPQGTLYGVSAQNGVVRILTNDADLERLEVKARALASITEGGAPSYRGDAALNVPIVEGRLAARAVVSYDKQGGWIDQPGERDANDADNLTLRLKVNAKPTEDLSIGLLAWHTNNKRGGRNIARDDGTTAITVDEFSRERYDIFGLRIGYDFGPVTLTSSTSHIDYSSSSTITAGTPGSSLLNTRFASKVFSEELGLSSNGDGPFTWSLGGMYRNVKDTVFQEIPGLLPFSLEYNDYSESIAVFGEATYAFADGRLELTGGLRYFHDNAKTIQRSDLSTGTAPPLVTNTAKFKKASPRVVLTWHPADDLTAYASYSEGFRSGFSQTPTVLRRVAGFPSVAPDNLKNYEIGAKGRILDGLVEFDLAGYFMDWAGVQQSLSVDVGLASPVAAVVNGTSASGVGVDLGITLRPAQGLTIGASYSWNDLKFDSDVVTVLSTGPVVLAPKGARIGGSPSTTASFNLDYSFPIGQLEGTLSGSVNYVSKRVTRALVGVVPTSIDSDSITTARASVGVKSPSGWGATVFVDNLTNYNGHTQFESLIPATRALVGDYRLRPRTIGVQFDVRF